MDRQHEVMTMFKQQLESGMENNRRLTETWAPQQYAGLDGRIARASSRTITDLIHRSRESNNFSAKSCVAERRMTLLVVFFFVAVVGLGFTFARTSPRDQSQCACAQRGD